MERGDGKGRVQERVKMVGDIKFHALLYYCTKGNVILVASLRYHLLYYLDLRANESDV